MYVWVDGSAQLSQGRCAQQDAWVHSMHENCAFSVPLVIPVLAA
jgi:hypothetical protein